MKMWHEARRQEKKIRGMLVDYRKRAERRQDFYEKIKADPTQFMQIYGRKCKIHLDPAVAVAAGEGSAIIVPWQGQQDNLIDRFDVRAHLDYIPPLPKLKDLEDISAEERQCNYERYRILAQNDFLGITEDKYLHQLHLEEQYGANAQLEAERNATKKKPSAGAAIGYSYDDGEARGEPFSHILSLPTPSTGASAGQPAADPEAESDSDVDMDVSIDISKLDTTQAHELNACGRNYGMKSNDFYSFLTKDADEADALRMAREEEQEKIMLSGRKSRRERRAQRERRFAGRPLSPPSYAAKEEPSASNAAENDTAESRSPSPENSGKITYITSFGGEDELQPHSKISINLSKPQKTLGGNATAGGATFAGQTMTYAEKVKENLERLKQMNQIKPSVSESPRKPMQYLRERSLSRSPSRSRSRYRRRSRSRSRSRSYRGRSRRGRRRSSSDDSYSRRRHSRSKSYRNRRYDRSRSRSKLRKRSRNRKQSTSVSSSSSSSPDRANSKSQRSSSSRSASPLSKSNSRLSRSLSKPLTSVQPAIIAVPTNQNNGGSAISSGPSALPPAVVAFPALPTAAVIAALTSVPPPPILTQQPPPIQIQKPQPMAVDPPEIPIKRYYGRKRDNDSSSSEELDKDNENELMDTSNSDRSNPFPLVSSALKANLGTQQLGKATSSSGKNLSSYSETKMSNSVAAGKTNLRERLKRKMQMLLNKQYKADKKAEIERTERQIQQQQEREDEMRELALKLRRRQRELRHKYGTPTSSPSKSSKSSDNEQEEPVIQIVKPPQLNIPARSRSVSKPPDVGQEKSTSTTRRSPIYRNRNRRTKSRSRSPERSRRRSRSASRGRRSSRSTSRRRYRGRDYSRDRSTNRDRSYDRDRARSRDRGRDRGDRARNRRSRERYGNESRYSESRGGREQQKYRRGGGGDRERDRSSERISSNRSPKLRRLVDY